MDFLDQATEFLANMSMGLKLVIALFIFVASVAQWRLYEKAGQPGWTIFIPVYNLVILNRVVGRPANHVWYYFIPVFNIYFICRVWIEVCQSFGKTSIVDYIFVILFNGFYILNLGLSYEEEYKGPAYGKENSSGSALGKTEFA
ncbi:MAG: DUF5684 domain-containing protein [Luteibaculum sp.]